MSEALATDAELEQGVPLAEGIYLTPVGARIVGEPSLEAYLEGVVRCQRLGNSCAWALGDLLYYGEDRSAYGETYSQIMDATQKSYWSLTQCMRVSKAYPHEDRLPEVSWSHHREALAADPAERRPLLEAALTSGQSAQHLRQQIATPRVPTPTVCPQCGHSWS
jgi:hypothetical protein